MEEGWGAWEAWEVSHAIQAILGCSLPNTTYGFGRGRSDEGKLLELQAILTRARIMASKLRAISPKSQQIWPCMVAE